MDTNVCTVSTLKHAFQFHATWEIDKLPFQPSNCLVVWNRNSNSSNTSQRLICECMPSRGGRANRGVLLGRRFMYFLIWKYKYGCMLDYIEQLVVSKKKKKIVSYRAISWLATNTAYTSARQIYFLKKKRKKSKADLQASQKYLDIV